MSVVGNRLLAAVPADRRDELLRLAREVEFPSGTRLFAEGGVADRFWTIGSGTVALDVHVPGRPSATVEILGPGELLGWSWLVPPHHWHLGAVAVSPVHAQEYDAAAVRALCDRDPVLGQALAVYVAGVVGHRLRATRRRLLDLYAPYGAGAAS
ncbi:cyclic nucleotide-binding domain-containing protein [Streptomyces sp. B6B3]|uniref:cyclic nucleotide-binding domain-containing protein n=1 Tax=Streptomyces sp. B6B3 TaxID=3153570 RepID=UPI00325E09F0